MKPTALSDARAVALKPSVDVLIERYLCMCQNWALPYKDRKSHKMIPVYWRNMSFEDAICCDEAEQSTREYFEQLSLHPESLSEILKIVLERLPSTSHIPLMIRQRKRDEIIISIQTLVALISSKFTLLMSLNGVKLLEMSFQRINFGLVQLLEDEASSIFSSSSKKPNNDF
jgi:hypothetical protein